MSKLGLIVGIDNYPSAPLNGCVNDATKMVNVLARNHDDSPNVNCKVMAAGATSVTRSTLKQAVSELFEKQTEVSVFFFAGHGTANNLGGYLVTQDAAAYDEGVAMADVLALANDSPARERIIILDCCHSGALGVAPNSDNKSALLAEGVSVLAACRDVESAIETGGGGLFTRLVVDAIAGGAADVCGKVTVASIYAYVDEVLSGWQQRPLFKSHVAQLVSVRQCTPSVPLDILRLLPKYFAAPDDEFSLDPSYEPDAEPEHEENEKIFGHLQKFRAARLVIPVGEEHMYYAAMNSRSCCLTALGQFYWQRVNSGKI